MSTIKPFKISDLKPRMTKSELSDNDLLLVSDADNPKNNSTYESRSLEFKVLKEKIEDRIAPTVATKIKDDVVKDLKPTINTEVHSEMSLHIDEYATILQYITIDEDKHELIIDCGDSGVEEND